MATKLGAPLVGINNRDIRQLERDDGDVGHTQSMITAKPEGAFIISESGLQTAEDVRRAVRLGADAVLVGSAIWKAEEPVAAYRRLCRRCFVKLCGIVDRKGLEICEAAGADMLGFVVDYPEPVPWNLTPERAERLIPLCGEAESCIVTGGDPDRVVGLA